MRRATRNVSSYDAFISYSHAADGQLAPALQAGLQRLARPWYRPRALRVFRDDTGLAINPHLWGSIAAALDQSRYFVALCSPEAAASPWVNREIEHWLESHDSEQMLPVVTDGTLSWDPIRGDYAPDSSALPPALQGRFAEEPRHLDLRWARDEEHLDLRHSRFREAVADLAAPLHGMAKDDLESEDIRLHRRARRLARAAVAGLALLLVLALIGGGLAVVNARRADRQSERAERQARLADARRLAAQARELFDDQLALGLLLAVEAQRLHDSPETQGALLTGVEHSPKLERLIQSQQTGTASAVSADGRLVAVGASDGTVSFINTTTGRPTGKSFSTPAAPTVVMAFSPDGTKLVTGARDGLLFVSEIATGRQVGPPLTGLDGQPFQPAFSPDGRTLASGSIRGGLTLWDLSSRDRDGQALSGPGATAYYLDWNPDGRSFATRAQDGKLLLWDAETRQPTGAVLSVPTTTGVLNEFWSPDGQTLAVDGEPGTVLLWDMKTLAVRTLATGRDESVVGFLFSHDGQTLAVSTSGGEVVLYEVASGRELGPALSGIKRGAYLLGAFTAEGRLVLHTNSGQVGVWNVAPSPNVSGRYFSVNGAAASVAFSPDGRSLAASTFDGNVYRWDIASGDQLGDVLSVGGQTQFLDIAFSPDGRRLAAGRSDGTVVFWDTATDEQLPRVLSGYPGHIWQVAFSPDGRALAAGGEAGVVLVWDTATGRQSGRVLDPEGGPIYGLDWSPDGKWLAVPGSDGAISIYNATMRRLVGTLEVPGAIFTRLAFSSDSRMLAVGDAFSNVYLLDVESRQRIGDALAGHQDVASDVAFTPDNKILATSGFDGRVIFWDVTSRQPIGVPRFAGLGRNWGVNMSPDGKTFATAHENGYVVFWDVDPDSWRARACELAGRNLTRHEFKTYLSGREYRATCAQWPIPQ